MGIIVEHSRYPSDRVPISVDILENPPDRGILVVTVPITGTTKKSLVGLYLFVPGDAIHANFQDLVGGVGVGAAFPSFKSGEYA
jgi:hypothetical protein